MDRIQAANELAFRVGFSGHSGHLRVEPLYTVEDRSDPIKSLPDFILVSFYFYFLFEIYLLQDKQISVRWILKSYLVLLRCLA